MLFVLCRHKGKILLSAVAGLIVAVAVFACYSPLYESQAKLLVRYVLDRSAVDPLDSRSGAGGPSSESLINSEVEILTSRDLATQVAATIGAERFLPRAVAGDGPANPAMAAGRIRLGLTATALKGTNIIVVTYQNHDPELATRVLNELVTRYFTKHLEIHRSAEAFEFVSRQADQVQARLNQTEEELRQLKVKAKIISRADSAASLNAELARCQTAMHTAETERAEQRARLAELERWVADSTSATDASRTKAPPQANSGDVHRYQSLVTAIARLRQTGIDLLARYTPENLLVKLNQTQVESLERQRRALEKSFPGLAATVVAAGVSSARVAPPPDLPSERARLAAIEAGIEALKVQMNDIQRLAAEFSEVEPQIAELERKKEMEEANYKYFAASLEKARVDEALDPSKMPNISVVQRPSTAFRTTDALTKIVLGVIGGGVALGLALAFLIEMVLDRTVKRPLELATRLQVPLLASIPYRGGGRRLRGQRSSPEASLDDAPRAALQTTRTRHPRSAPWDVVGDFMRPFARSIRDRLTLYFELRQMNHQPKLIAVTSCAEGAGTSTLAASLATAFSEIGEGRVLLVDMNVGRPELHHFFGGKRACTLTEALQTTGGNGGNGNKRSRRASEKEDDNLTVATGASSSHHGQGGVGADAGALPVVPRRFYDLIPRFKASDFSYIIFDMPALGEQTSTTLAVAGHMDKVLLVVEAERSDRGLVKRAYAELAAVKANVSAVFNKHRSYGPKWLLADAV